MADAHERFMARALEISLRGAGRTSPNPLVGCVLVRSGEIIAEGWHDQLGGLHAEQMAVAEAEARGVDVAGTTAYVTLEPCHHHGRTPPCTETLLWAGIKDVVIAHPDPNPMVRGGGRAYLMACGATVTEGPGHLNAQMHMAEFLHWCTTRRPLVTVKIAVDCNGSVDDRSNSPSRFTSAESLDLVHVLRGSVDAILVGAETVLRDDPRLTVRRGIEERMRQPLRIVIDPVRRTGDDIAIHEGITPSLRIVTVPILSDSIVEEVRSRQDAKGNIDLFGLLEMLGDRDIHHLLVEGGPETVRRFMDAGLIDRSIIIESPIEHVNPVLATELISSLKNHYDSTESFEAGGDRWIINQRIPIISPTSIAQQLSSYT